MKTATIAALAEAKAARRPVVFAKNLTDLREIILPDPQAPVALAEAAALALRENRVSTQEIGGQTWFIEPRLPPPRLILVGGVQIAQALAPLAAMLGFDVTIVDPRRSFASAERFPVCRLAHGWPDEALDALVPDRNTAVVTLTHDPKLDDAALDRALQSEAFYIGSLGSRKTQAARLERLAALGHTPAQLARIHGPVGLDIGAVTAPEIALSIIGEIIAARRNSRLASRTGTPAAPPRIGAIVLAAGKSSRMGGPNKLLAAMPDGRSMIAQSVAHVLDSPAHPVIVVTGHQAREIQDALAGKPVRFRHAADHALGLSASLRAGIAALPAEIDAVLVCLGDMPLVDAGILRNLLAAYDPASGREIVIPVSGGRRGNPVVWGRRFFPEFAKLAGDAGARQIMPQFAESIAEIPVESDAVLRDFDTPEMLESLTTGAPA